MDYRTKLKKLGRGGASFVMRPDGTFVGIPYPTFTPEFKRHAAQLNELRENGDCLTREEFDHYTGVLILCYVCVGRSETLMIDERDCLISQEQRDIAGRIARGWLASGDDDISAPSEWSNATCKLYVEDGARAKLELNEVTFSNIEHDFVF